MLKIKLDKFSSIFLFLENDFEINKIFLVTTII